MYRPGPRRVHVEPSTNIIHVLRHCSTYAACMFEVKRCASLAPSYMSVSRHAHGLWPVTVLDMSNISASKRNPNAQHTARAQDVLMLVACCPEAQVPRAHRPNYQHASSVVIHGCRMWWRLGLGACRTGMLACRGGDACGPQGDWGSLLAARDLAEIQDSGGDWGEVVANPRSDDYRDACSGDMGLSWATVLRPRRSVGDRASSRSWRSRAAPQRWLPSRPRPPWCRFPVLLAKS